MAEKVGEVKAVATAAATAAAKVGEEWEAVATAVVERAVAKVAAEKEVVSAAEAERCLCRVCASSGDTDVCSTHPCRNCKCHGSCRQWERLQRGRRCKSPRL